MLTVIHCYIIPSDQPKTRHVYAVHVYGRLLRRLPAGGRQQSGRVVGAAHRHCCDPETRRPLVDRRCRHFKLHFLRKKCHFSISTDTNDFINQTCFLVLVIVALLETKKTNMGSEYPTVGQLFHMQYPSYFFWRHGPRAGPRGRYMAWYIHFRSYRVST